MTAAKKATIYVDIDDEITSIIDKVVSSKEKIVALVLPKRATVLQSIVNMKLLKRSADEVSKKLVLITSDGSVLPLAGIAGVHVAKTLQSKPAVPTAPSIEGTDDSEVPDDDVKLDPEQSVGALASAAEDEEVAEIPEATSAPLKKKTKPKKDRKLKVPDFSKFRTKLILVVALLILLISGWVVASRMLPKADIVIKTDTKTFSKQLEVPAALEPADEATVLALSETLEKESAQTVPATGQRNDGKKAEGTMTLTNCADDQDVTIPKGSNFTKDGKNFVTTKQVKLTEPIIDDGECKSFNGFNQKDVAVVAAEGGQSFNIGEGSYNSSIAGVNAYGSDMEGGTDDIKTVVSQEDINKATEQLKAKTTEGSVDELKALLTSKGFIPFESTLNTPEPIVNASQSAGEEAGSVTVNGKATFIMVGVSKEQIDEAIINASTDDIDSTAQAISDTGLSGATLRLSEVSPGVYSVAIDTLVTAGPQLDTEQLKQEVLGKKFGESESILSSKAGVVDVDIDLSPFWVGAVPGNAEKVTITVENIDDNE